LKGGRFPVVAFIIGAFFLYYYFWRRTKGWGKVIPVKYIVRIVMIIAGVIAAFWFSKELVGRLSKDNDLMGYVTRYFGGGPVLFELYLKDSSMLNVIGVVELFFQSSSIAGSTMSYSATFLITCLVYLCLTSIATILLNIIEKRINNPILR
jgi:hypothetical protein